MKLDVDIMRSVLLEFEGTEDWAVWVGYSDERDAEQRSRYFHALLLSKAGLLDRAGGEGCSFRLTEQGAGFIEVISDEATWDFLIKTVRQLETFCINDIADAARFYLAPGRLRRQSAR